jgi:hypothetical protein
MLIIKKIIALLVCVALTCSMVGCATTYHRGDGVVVCEKKIKDKDYKPHATTQNGAIVGGTAGGVSGAVAGGFAGFLIGLPLAAFTTPAVLIATTVGGVGIGAVAFGTAGAAVGSGVGYAMDVNTPNAGLYEFVVQADNALKPFVITQYSAPIPINTQVHILEKDNLTFIKQK